MSRPPKPPTGPRPIETLIHADTRRNIPTAELQSLAQQMEETAPVDPAHYKRTSPLAAGETRPRDPDLDPQIIWRGMRITLNQAQRAKLQETGEVELGDAQLVWRGKDTQDWSDLVVNPPPIYIQEKVHPKAIIEGLKKEVSARVQAKTVAPDLFAAFNGLDDPEARLEFYQHHQHWSNRMVLGDSLQVMASLAEREGLRGKVQCIYFDPPYGIKFNSNWQVSTQSRDVKDGKREDVSREPEQVKAFRDTWKDGIHSYLTYLRDRMTVARELLADSGSIFVQIGEENSHRVRFEEVFGPENYVAEIVFSKTSGSTGDFLGPTFDKVLWWAKRRSALKYRPYLLPKRAGEKGGTGYRSVRHLDGRRRPLTKEEFEGTAPIPEGWRIYFRGDLSSQSIGRAKGEGAASWFPVNINGQSIKPSMSVRWKTNEIGMDRLLKAQRVDLSTGNAIGYVRFLNDFPVFQLTDLWTDTLGQNQLGGNKIYVVQTALTVVQRCILMATDPGDLVLDPTCGSGTTATVSEQWGRRCITIDTSRVALALARTRIMASKYPYYLLADSSEGREKKPEYLGKDTA